MFTIYYVHFCRSALKRRGDAASSKVFMKTKVPSPGFFASCKLKSCWRRPGKIAHKFQPHRIKTKNTQHVKSPATTQRLHSVRQRVGSWEIVLKLISKLPPLYCSVSNLFNCCRPMWIRCIGRVHSNFYKIQSRGHGESWTFSSDLSWTAICSRLWSPRRGSSSPTQWLGGLGKTLGEGGSLNFAPA